MNHVEMVKYRKWGYRREERSRKAAGRMLYAARKGMVGWYKEVVSLTE